MNEIVNVNDSSAGVNMLVRYSEELNSLTESDKEKCRELTSQIDVDNPRSVSSFGYDINMTLANQADVLLEKSNASKASEFNKLTSDLLIQIKDIGLATEEDEKDNKYFDWMKSLPFVNRFVKVATDVKIKNASPKENVDEVKKKIQSLSVLAQKEIAVLDEMYKNMVSYKKMNRERIIALMLLEKEAKESIEKLEASGEWIDAYEMRNKKKFLNALSKRITDMSMIDVEFDTTLHQIDAICGNYDTIVYNAQVIVGQVIPIWKNHIVIGNEQSTQKLCADMEDKVRTSANDMLKKNAEMLKQNSIEIAKMNEAPVFDIDTLKKSTETLIETIKEVDNIHKKGQESRAGIVKEVENIKQRLLTAIDENTAKNLIGSDSHFN